MKDYSVRMTFEQLDAGGSAGLRRRLRAMVKGRVYKNGRPSDDVLYKYDIEGAMSELAVALVLGMEWTETTGLDKRTGDVGRFQVRSTDREDGSLLLYEDDDPEDLFILVTHTIPVFTLRGWIIAGEGMVPDYWRTQTGRPCYMVPQWALYTMNKL